MSWHFGEIMIHGSSLFPVCSVTASQYVKCGSSKLNERLIKGPPPSAKTGTPLSHCLHRCCASRAVMVSGLCNVLVHILI